MGGCRCNFRECHVNSQKFPNIHFFRFPLKEVERFGKWRQYCQMERMLDFSEVRRKNTCICARHFRPECFMNYKQERLTPRAVPTIMRLSVDKALDFELDIKNGVMVDIEKPILKHLVPPDGFECPLYLTNDKILIEKLNELQSQRNNTNENVEYICDEPEELEDIHIVPVFKRPRQKCDEEKVDSFTRLKNKKCRILNTCVEANEVRKFSTVVLATLDDGKNEGNEIKIIETVQVESPTELDNNDEQLFLTSESFNYDCGEDIELFQVHPNSMSDEFSVHDSDATIVQIESQVYPCKTKSEKVEIVNVKNQLEFGQLKQKYDALNAKYSLLENENEKLKQSCEHIEEIKHNVLVLQMENDNLKKSIVEFNSTKEKLHKYSEENSKLKNEIASNETLKSELMSRKEDNKALKKLVEQFKNDNSKKLDVELGIKNQDINGLIKKFDVSQQQLNGTINELKEAQANLNNLKTENKRLTETECKLKKYLNNIKNILDIKQTQFNTLKLDFDNLQENQSVLEQKNSKLLALQSQEATVSTSLKSNKNSSPTAPVTTNSFTKTQLFNGIKRYICSTMVSLLRMEMFGSSEREWKTDERQVAVDILGLGEITYKYFTDEWRIRLPALRDARAWLVQSEQLIDDEEDL